MNMWLDKKLKTHASTNKFIYISVAMVYKSKVLVLHYS